MDSGVSVVSTTVDAESKAQELAELVVGAGLAACVQFMPIRSVYRWKGVVESTAEYLLLAKTSSSLVDDLTDFIKKHHSYEVPEIIVTPTEGGLQAYLDWILAEAVPKAE